MMAAKFGVAEELDRVPWALEGATQISCDRSTTPGRRNVWLNRTRKTHDAARLDVHGPSVPQSPGRRPRR